MLPHQTIWRIAAKCVYFVGQWIVNFIDEIGHHARIFYFQNEPSNFFTDEISICVSNYSSNSDCVVNKIIASEFHIIAFTERELIQYFIKVNQLYCIIWF